MKGFRSRWRGAVLAGGVRWAVGVVAMAVLSPGAPAQPGEIVAVEARALGVGDEAPPLRVGHWLKGEPVERFEPGRVYVVEFWATWCGPCIAGIPHLSEVQERFAEHLDLVSVTTADPGNTLEKVEAFVEAREAEMGYTVAFDDLDLTWSAYMHAAGQNGIPCAFVIDKSGRVAWIGHPASPAFEETIEAIVEDRFDVEVARALREAEDARRAELEQAQRDLHGAWNAGETERAFELADTIVETDPETMQSWAWWKFEALMVGMEQPQRGQAYARELMEGVYREDARMLLRLAYGIAESVGIEGRDLDLALELAERAVTLRMGEDAQTLTGLAMVRRARGELDEAIAVLERASAVAQDRGMRRSLENELEFLRMEREMAERERERKRE